MPPVFEKIPPCCSFIDSPATLLETPHAKRLELSRFTPPAPSSAVSKVGLIVRFAWGVSNKHAPPMRGLVAPGAPRVSNRGGRLAWADIHPFRKDRSGAGSFVYLARFAWGL